MSLFRAELDRRQGDRLAAPGPRRWLFVPYDQLTDRIGPLSREDPTDVGIVLVESAWKAARRPYHRQKLALVLANLRHFALEQAERGVAVRHVWTDGPYRDALGQVVAEVGRLEVMEPAERELRVDLAPLVEDGRLVVIPHEGWLSTEADFEASQEAGAPWRMDRFYAHLRRSTGLLMTEEGKPEGGKYSFDPENRRRWDGTPEPPEVPTFTPDPVTREVAELVTSRFGRHPGRLELSTLPATREDAERLWEGALASCLPHFGPYEDAMSARARTLFHTRASPLVNLHRLLPLRVVRDAAETDVPLQSREGFVRQVLGWREFVHHVHRRTDGFRSLPDGYGPFPTAEAPGDGGYAGWRGEAWAGGRSGWAEGESERAEDGEARREEQAADGGVVSTFLGGETPLPPAFWGRESGLRCLDTVVDAVWEEGWSHHITRLMVLSNIARLLDVSPRELADWFWVAYADAFDWVVEPNVLGMGTFSLGDLFTSKPYVSGAAYIHRMSDFCGGCRFDPEGSCPLTRLYWAFLERHRERLSDVPRVRLQLASASKRDAEERERDRGAFETVRDALLRGERLEPG